MIVRLPTKSRLAGVCRPTGKASGMHATSLPPASLHPSNVYTKLRTNRLHTHHPATLFLHRDTQETSPFPCAATRPGAAVAPGASLCASTRPTMSDSAWFSTGSTQSACSTSFDSASTAL
eukprot:359474-Chlamydomonas_euryale.AAC.4